MSDNAAAPGAQATAKDAMFFFTILNNMKNNPDVSDRILKSIQLRLEFVPLWEQRTIALSSPLLSISRVHFLWDPAARNSYYFASHYVC